jgi:hypothetical protein
VRREAALAPARAAHCAALIDDGAIGARRLCRELAGRGHGVCRAGDEEQHRREAP